MGDVGIGIDFGTSFSCVAVCRDGKVEVIANEHDKRLTPSYVAFTEEERLYGDAARHQNPLNLKNTFYQTKMLLGRKYEEIPKGAFIGYDIEASDSKLKLPFIYKGKNKPLSPEQVSAMVIGKMKKDAEIYLDTEVKRAVISVPASFNHAQRKATIDAGKIAGFETVELINGTTAAAIAYGLDREKDQERNVLILDFGGGKFDVSIVKIHKRNFQVMGAYGDSCFGGEDFDNNLVRHFTGDESNFNDKKAICRLQEACEKAKRTLSGASRARIRVDCLFGGKPFGSEITRSDFEDINKEYFDRALEIVKKVFRCANVKESEITELVLVGGSTRIPKFRHLIQEYFNGMELSRTINPDEAVACGAALHCASKKMNGYTMVDVASRPIVIKGDRNTQEYTLVKPLTNLPSTTKLTASPGSQWQVFEGEPVVDSSTDSIFTVQADSMTRTEFVWVVEMNGLVNVETSVNGETTKPNIVSRNTRNVSKDDIQKMMEQHAEFQMDDDLIAKASDERNDLEKSAYNIKQSITSAVYKDKLENNVKEEITSECNRILEWLDENQNASVDECSTKRNELDRICLPLLEKKREEQKKREEEYKLRQKARNDLKFFINDAENKAKLERFKFAPEQPIILRDCQNLTKLLVDNQNATINEINDNLQKFRKWIETMFEKMEQSVKQKIEDEKRELCKEAQNELKNFIEDAESRVKLQDYEFARDKPEILQNCQNLRKWMEDNQNATINDINDKSQKFRKWIDDTFEKMEQVVKNPSKKELDKRRNALEKNCYPIFAQVDNKVK
uniref:heat shock 70 kDa protein 1-like isoform X2 n=1 Tax=Styela clava TaxID=7725 RepID=UPI0019397F16|nr:heat shock 70 kDa protein 1-like isoform X2 [Styela clava]